MKGIKKIIKYGGSLKKTGIILFLLISLSLFVFFLVRSEEFRTQVISLQSDKTDRETQLTKITGEFSKLKNEDQYKINQKQLEEIKNIKSNYKKSIDLYEQIQDLKVQKQDTKDLEKLYASIVNDLAVFNYSSAEATLTTLSGSVKKINSAITANSIARNSIQTPAAINNSAPGSGYSFQSVSTDGGTFNVSIIASDLNSTRVIADTASESDCSNNCPVLSLGDYVSRNAAFAGINGTFFCPAEYPSCAGKTGSFDTLLMNKNKYYFNSENNVYSTVPLVYFSGNTMGVRSRSSDWGRDSGVDSVIALQQLYVLNDQNVYGGSNDSKITSKGARTFIGNKGSTVYIGIIYNASAEDVAKVLTTLKLENALGLDQGGSTALWFGGYKAGPGRNIPNAILFVRK